MTTDFPIDSSTSSLDARRCFSSYFKRRFAKSPELPINMPSREASHAGSWYADDRQYLTRQLDHWLAQVPNEIEGIGSLPVPGARFVIAPYV